MSGYSLLGQRTLQFACQTWGRWNHGVSVPGAPLARSGAHSRACARIFDGVIPVPEEPLYSRSKAPMSQAVPCGRGTPR
jgi:hypothetical protein